MQRSMLGRSAGLAPLQATSYNTKSLRLAAPGKKALLGGGLPLRRRRGSSLFIKEVRAPGIVLLRPIFLASDRD